VFQFEFYSTILVFGKVQTPWQMESENNCKTFKEAVVLEKCTLSCLHFQDYFVNFFSPKHP